MGSIGERYSGVHSVNKVLDLYYIESSFKTAGMLPLNLIFPKLKKCFFMVKNGNGDHFCDFWAKKIENSRTKFPFFQRCTECLHSEFTRSSRYLT